MKFSTNNDAKLSRQFITIYLFCELSQVIHSTILDSPFLQDDLGFEAFFLEKESKNGKKAHLSGFLQNNDITCSYFQLKKPPRIKLCLSE